MRLRYIISVVCAVVMHALATAQIYDPVKWEVSMSKIASDGKATITFDATIDEGWHVYSTKENQDGPVPTQFVFTAKEGVQILSKINPRSKLIEEFEPAFQMTLGWYEKKATFQQTVKIKDKNNYKLEGYVRYMTCNNENCLPPSNYNFNLTKIDTSATAEIQKPKETKGEETPAKKADEEEAIADVPSVFSFKTVGDGGTAVQKVGSENTYERVDTWANVEAEMASFGDNEDAGAGDSLWKVFLMGLLGGFIAVITPCVWPIIPMTVSFFLKRGKDPKKGKKAAIVYGLSIVLIYVGVGLLITLVFGASGLNNLSTNAIFNVFLFALLVLFAVSFFGGFEIALPATWSTKIDQKVDKTVGLFSILLMAFTLVIVSFSCTGPIIGTLLVDVAGKNDILAPAIGMLGFAIALALPFTLFAFFPSWLSNMPRSGGWLNSVKILLGFFELAFSLKFLSMADLAYGWHILDREVFIVLWIVIFAMAGMYLIGKIQFPGDDAVETVSIPRLFLALASFSFAIYLIPGLWGAPLKSVSAFVPPISTQDFNLYSDKVEPKFFDYDDAIKYSEQTGKPIIIDFTGHACVNCRKMESAVWSDPRVSNIMKEDYILTSLYVDDRKQLETPEIVTDHGVKKTLYTVGDKWSYLQRSKFGANAQPFYVLLDSDGKPLNNAFAFTEEADAFLKFLRTGMKNYRKR